MRFRAAITCRTIGIGSVSCSRLAEPPRCDLGTESSGPNPNPIRVSIFGHPLSVPMTVGMVAKSLTTCWLIAACNVHCTTSLARMKRSARNDPRNDPALPACLCPPKLTVTGSSGLNKSPFCPNVNRQYSLLNSPYPRKKNGDDWFNAGRLPR